MAEMKIGKAMVLIKDTPCHMDGIQSSTYYDQPHINIQVVVTNICNARCKFCVYHNNDTGKFNTEKFIEGIKSIREKVRIPTITFTGGETSFELDRINQCIYDIQRIDPDIRLKVNTNGLRFKEAINLPIWQLSLSRHSVSDTENEEIFGLVGLDQLPSIDDLRGLKKHQLNRLHLSCNIIKGYVDSFDKMLEYADVFGNIVSKDIGFVSLMGVNEYAKEHSIDFKTMQIKENNRFLYAGHGEYIKAEDGLCHCECQTYWMLTSGGKLITCFNRFARNSNCPEANIVYKVDHWRQGFNGRVLEI